MSHYFDEQPPRPRPLGPRTHRRAADPSLHAAHRPRRVQPRPPRRRHGAAAARGAPPPPAGRRARPRLRRRADRPRAGPPPPAPGSGPSTSTSGPGAVRRERRRQRPRQRRRRRARRRAGDVRFDLIWSNPPIRIGKAALHELLATWLGRLTRRGPAVLVVQKHLGADSLQRWLIDEQGWPTERLASAKGYRLLDVPADPRRIDLDPTASALRVTGGAGRRRCRARAQGGAATR